MITHFEPGRASFVIDGQFGSTGKGLAAAYLALNTPGGQEPMIATTNAAPNAGHTTIIRGAANPKHKKFVCYHLPTIGILNPNATIYINAGAMIDIDMLFTEMATLGVDYDRVFIHPRAVIIDKTHKNTERAYQSGPARIGGTQKGCGAALAAKVMRTAKVARDSEALQDFFKIEAIDINKSLRGGVPVSVEVAQGMDLGINHGLSYPHCTSREVSIAQAMADAGVHPVYLGRVLMTARTYPIRVGHIYDKAGKISGYSGPFYPDQEELLWDKHFPGFEPERTTVTKRIRRIASWSSLQYEKALLAIRPDVVFLNFVNYIRSEAKWRALSREMINSEREMDHHVKMLYGLGPAVEDVTEHERDISTMLKWGP